MTAPAIIALIRALQGEPAYIRLLQSIQLAVQSEIARELACKDPLYSRGVFDDIALSETESAP